MTETLNRLVYYSRNRIDGPPEVLAGAIEAVLTASQRNNAKVGVTGALMFNAGCFAQVLEGPQDAVEDVFERIQRDERHGDVSLLAFESIEARAFAGWSMGFVGASVVDAARYGDVALKSGFDPSRMTAKALFKTLYQLAMEEERYPNQ